MLPRILSSALMLVVLLKILEAGPVTEALPPSSAPSAATTASVADKTVLGYDLASLNASAVDTEVSDLLDVDKVNITNQIVFIGLDAQVQMDDDHPKEDAEFIEDSEDTEDDPDLRDDESSIEAINAEQWTSENESQLAVILASAFVCICLGGFLSLFLWRRYLERRYGNRQMVYVMKDEDDMKYFSL